MLRVWLPVLLVVSIAFTVPPVHGFDATIAVSQAEMANISSASSQISFRWRLVDQAYPVLITLFFHSFENSGLILDEGLLSLSRPQYPNAAQDPQGDFKVSILSGTTSQDGKILFKVESALDPVAITVAEFSGPVGGDIGLPGTSHRKTLITIEDETVDVLSVTGDNWLASFTWKNVPFENLTVPQVSAFDTTGLQIDARFVLNLNVQLMAVRGSNGFWISALEILPGGVSWLLESDNSLITRPNTGYRVKSLPLISPSVVLRSDTSLAVPEAKVDWLLPLGANKFSLFISGFEVPNPGLGTILDLSYASGGVLVSKNENTGIYTAKFKAARLGVIIPVTISTIAPDGRYESTTRVEFRPHAFFDPSSSFNYYTLSTILLAGSFFTLLGVVVYRRRRPRRIDMVRDLEGMIA